MVGIMANLNATMYHIFIQDKIEMPTLVNILSNSLEPQWWWWNQLNINENKTSNF